MNARGDRVVRQVTVALALVLAAGCGPEQAAVEAPAARDDSSSRFQVPGLEVEQAVAGPGELAWTVVLPGRVRFNGDRRAAVVARLDGVLSEVLVELGQEVSAGELLGVLRSRELARARTAYIEATHHVEFAGRAFEREELLWKKQISSELDYRQAEHDLEAAVIEHRMAGQELLALGIEATELSVLRGGDEAPGIAAGLDLTRFELRSPVAGTLVAKEAVLGEAYTGDARLFEVADRSTVWVDLDVRAADLARLVVGRPVEVVSRELGRTGAAEIDYLDARVDPNTQAGLARVVLPNGDGQWRPGLFVTVRTEVGRRAVELAVPSSAVHQLGERAVVFVELGPGEFEARPVALGEGDTRLREIRSGLARGERVAASEGLLLKSVWLGHGGEE